MNITSRNRLSAILFAIIALSLPALSRADSSIALKTAESATNRILELSTEARSYINKDPNRYYQQVSDVLNEVMDFQAFARGVMATYASSRQYNALQTDAERRQFSQRIKRFGDKLERILIITYSDAVLSFKGEKIVLSIAPGSDTAPHRAIINQEIYSNTGKVYLVQYTMREERPDVWKVTNLTVDGANLGQIYRTQFATEVEKAGGDLDKTIDNWGQ
ncbi:MAG: ABC transporter substrate-binding protein [Alcanivoracaceae bacterium]|jgi:phospholipid transport system substrate-binding protein|nr:ABC transporter substrate-binding protein [Alcanivoracaceae bacterium]